MSALRQILAAGAIALFGLTGARAQDGASNAYEPHIYETTGQITVGGERVRYRVKAGETVLKNDEGDESAVIFATTYIRSDVTDPARPVAFIFNGGPGSASLWLHMGVFGPKRVILPSDPADDGAAPFTIAENSLSILDVADLVFIDPVGTGWSRTINEGDTADYWGVQEDARSLAEFIRLWLTENKRWNSPKYLLGESYGTTRIAALLGQLEGGWNDIAINGVGLISVVLNFGLDATDPGNDIGYVGLMPGYAATAWYHDKVNKAQWNNNFNAFLDDARAFAVNDYLPALVHGVTLSDADQRQIAARLSAFTGLSQAYIEGSNLRVPLFRFMRELRRDERLSVGRLDSRFTGPEPDGVQDSASNDPSAAGIDAAYTGAMLDYFTREIGVDMTERYNTLSGSVFAGWNQDGGQAGGRGRYVNVAPMLQDAMRQNHDLRVLAANGYYDLATPFFATEMLFNQPYYDQDRVTLTYYEAGHMMYLHQPSIEALSRDIRDFIVAGQ
ncbi:S10 family peptidase [Woodsholea maritima]|uniref:S10 family peptidase n=1 Tax=Woodsholea maritima TaxID=240237 RepID=UPI000362770C|nr:hypothetical protein [Woodsholea maritima]